MVVDFLKLIRFSVYPPLPFRYFGGKYVPQCLGLILLETSLL